MYFLCIHVFLTFLYIVGMPILCVFVCCLFLLLLRATSPLYRLCVRGLLEGLPVARPHASDAVLGPWQIPRVSIHIYICTYVHMYICTCIHIYTHTYIHIHIYIYIYIHTFIYNCIYMYIQLYIYIHIYIPNMSQAQHALFMCLCCPLLIIVQVLCLALYMMLRACLRFCVLCICVLRHRLPHLSLVMFCLL